VTASDLGTQSQSSSTTARMFKIQDRHRMVLVVNKAGLTETEIEEYRVILQQIMGKDVIIERTTARTQLVNNGTMIDYDKTQTDITFTCVEKSLESLCTYTSNVGNSITLAGADTRFRTDAGVSVTDLHPPFRAGGFAGDSQRQVTVQGGDYFGWMAWWPLFLLAALIFLLALLGIILLLCCAIRWRRHYKAGLYHANLAAVGANGYGANGYGYEHGSAYGESVVVKNKDLEEQSLCMYVPPEGDNELGEINFAFSEAALGQTQAGAAQTATAGANGHVNTGGGHEEVTEQSYSEFYQSGGAAGAAGAGGAVANQQYDQVDSGGHNYNTMGGESGVYNTLGGGGGSSHYSGGVSRGGTMGRTDVIVDTLGASSNYGGGGGAGYTTVEETTTHNQEGFEEQEHNISFA